MKKHIAFLGILICAMPIVACTEDDKDDAESTFAIALEQTLAMTPNATHRTGVFARLFYNADRDRFYLLYQGFRDGTATNNFSDADYAYVELDTDLNETGETGVLPYEVKGDFAMAFDGTQYYFLYVPLQATYRVNALDEDFAVVDTVDIAFDGDFEAGNDQLMNYTNGQLVIGSLYDTAGTGPGYFTGSHTGTTYPHLFFYDTSLTEAEDDRTLEDESNIPSGGSIIFNDNKWHMVTADEMGSPSNPGKLYVYQWDADWSYLGKTQLASDGQWSQGLLYDNDRYYVAYHTGPHANGNVSLAAFDTDWNLLSEIALTNYTGDFTAQRPWIIKVGDKIYVSYDVATAGDELKDWQATIAVVSISE